MARPPNRERGNPNQRKEVLPPPPDMLDLKAVAAKCRYAGSPYHRTMPDAFGNRPVHHPGKSKCPEELQRNPSRVTQWLRKAIRQGQFGEFDNGYPVLVWYKHGDHVFEARLHNRESGEYHGYPLEPHDHITGLE